MTGPTRVVLLKTQTVDEQTAIAYDCIGLSNIVLYLFGHGVTSSGAITYEEATQDPSTTTPGYDGTWSIIGSAVNASTVDGNKCAATHLAVGGYGLVRARITTVIGGGGSISVVLVGTP